MINNTIRAIGFDYMGVVGGGDQFGKGFTENVCKILNISKERYREVYFSHNHLINTGKVSTRREFWKILLRILGKEDSLEAVCEFNDQVGASYTTLNKDILTLTKAMRSRGYRLGLLSNATIEDGEKLRSIGLDKYFDIFHISAETGFQKPDKKAFEIFARDLNVDLKELVFIDDAATSLSTAQECGYTPIHYKSYPELITELDSLGISKVIHSGEVVKQTENTK